MRVGSYNYLVLKLPDAATVRAAAMSATRP